MSFYARLNYLVDTHQAADHKAARQLIGRQKQSPRISSMRTREVRLPYADN